MCRLQDLDNFEIIHSSIKLQKCKKPFDCGRVEDEGDQAAGGALFKFCKFYQLFFNDQ